MSVYATILLVLSGVGVVMGLLTLGSVLRERWERDARLEEARRLNERIRLDEEVPSPVLREHYEARLDEVIGGFAFHDYAHDPQVKEEVDAYLRRFKDRRGRR